MLAVTQGHFAIVKLLVEHQADVNAEDEDNDTALHLALLRQGSANRNNALGDAGIDTSQVTTQHIFSSTSNSLPPTIIPTAT